MFLMCYVLFHVLFPHTFGSERLYQQLKPIMDLQNDFKNLKTRFILYRSIKYTFPKDMDVNCVAMASDSSYFAEKFLAEVAPFLPSYVLMSNKNPFQCAASFVATGDVLALSAALQVFPRFPHHRLWCFVNGSTVTELEKIFTKKLGDFGDANVILIVHGDYSAALRIEQPDRILERIQFPKQGEKWPVIKNYIKTFSGKEIKYSTTRCDIHSIPLSQTEREIKTQSPDKRIGDKDNRDSFMKVWTGGNPGVRHWGMDWNVFKAIVEGMKLKPILVKVPEESAHKIGKFVNGSWVGGVLGNVDRGIADVGFCGFIFEINKFRGGIVMGNPVRQACILYAVPHPTPNSDDWTVVFHSLSPTVHLFIGIFIIAFATTVRTIANIEFFHSKKIAEYRSLGYCMKVAWGVVLQGDFPNPWGMGVLRPFLFLWALFSILMGSSFSSHLVSNFARPPYNPKPKTIEELVKFGYESPTSSSHPFPLITILNPEEPTTREWLNRIYSVYDNNQLIEILDKRALQAIFGFKYDDDVFIPYIQSSIPNEVLEKYETIDRCIDKIYEGFAFRRGSPFIRAFNDYSLNLMQSGFLDKYNKDILMKLSRMYPSMRAATKPRQSSYVIKPLSIFHLRGIFMVLVMGLVISTLVLIVEVIYYYELNKYRASVQAKPHIKFVR